LARLERLARNKNSTLLEKFVNYDSNLLIKFGPVACIIALPEYDGHE
jgi:hypothetical protein